jgi:hypothetical protein
MFPCDLHLCPSNQFLFTPTFFSGRNFFLLSSVLDLVEGEIYLMDRTHEMATGTFIRSERGLRYAGMSPAFLTFDDIMTRSLARQIRITPLHRMSSET